MIFGLFILILVYLTFRAYYTKSFEILGIETGTPNSHTYFNLCKLSYRDNLSFVKTTTGLANMMKPRRNVAILCGYGFQYLGYKEFDEIIYENFDPVIDKNELGCYKIIVPGDLIVVLDYYDIYALPCLREVKSLYYDNIERKLFIEITWDNKNQSTVIQVDNIVGKVLYKVYKI